jgi:ATP-dependent Clp protease ATP-binding subunit ClpA
MIVRGSIKRQAETLLRTHAEVRRKVCPDSHCEDSPMFERFTDSARKVMALANQEAQRWNHEFVGTEHILLGLVKDFETKAADGTAKRVLSAMHISLDAVRFQVEARMKPGPDMVLMGRLPQTPRAKKAIELAIEEARNLNHNYLGTEHLLLGLVRESDGIAAKALSEVGVTFKNARDEVLRIIGEPNEIDPGAMLRELPIAVVGDPTILTREEYAELITILGDIVRANGGKGVERIWESECDLPVDAEVPV